MFPSMARVARMAHPGRVRFFLRKLRHPIGPGDLVVDVGSGGDPHPRADVLVERSVDTDWDRTVKFRRSAPTVLADICALPFRTGTFDFSICSHVLEHLDDPVTAAAELSRISRAGYIETPSYLHEKMFPMTWHKWMVVKTGDRIQFEPKESALLDESLGDYFRPRWGIDRTFMSFIWSHADDLFIQHYWKTELKTEATGKPTGWVVPAADSTDEDEWEVPASSNSRRRLYEVASRFRYSRYFNR